MVARTHCVVTVGVEPRLVSVEADVSQGLPGMTIVGLGDTAISEARDRVRAAVQHSRADWPRTRVTVALLPSSLPKRGSSLDAAIAVAVLAAHGQVPAREADRAVIQGELGLDGRLHPVSGVIAASILARGLGDRRLLVPSANVAEARLVAGLDAGGVRDIDHLIGVLRGDEQPDEPANTTALPPVDPGPDLADVRGQHEARHAVEIAAAGGHHLSLVGAAGAGKSLLASRLPGLLPDLDDADSLEVTSIWSVSGRLSVTGDLLRRPPFEAPHHSASSTAVIGGGQSGRVRVGAITLAHRGVLFLDEAPEFPRNVLDALRQPLEEGEVRLARSDLAVILPARFQLVVAANPCPCGRGLDDDQCRCSPMQRRRYAQRLSGPITDRIDLRLPVRKPSAVDLREPGEASSIVAARVRGARERSAARWRGAGLPWRVNGDIPGPAARRDWAPDDRGTAVLARAVTSGALSMRGADRVLRVAWTLADLAGRRRPCVDDVARALALRGPEPS
ncbi:MAG: YifB family Mg chelatase-like AAA ATPase [Candidatus Nanopelagicales bacterium]